jgi:predicted MPP superfamily phosphohydrolase
MRRLVHISDLHFGQLRTDLLDSLSFEIQRCEPHLIIVSGDLTQRAKPAQFRQARCFLDQLNFPKLVVPGNHDIPLGNLWLRMTNPLSRYQHFISENLTPSFEDEMISVQGLTTAHGRTIAGPPP